jgi:hypothetical protein
MSTKIFDQLYVTIQYRKDANNESGLLGFASPYTKDAAFKKRKETQDKWAYGGGINVIIDAEDGITVEPGPRVNPGWDASALFIANCYPRIVKNEPTEGFQLAKSVRRYGWSGSGNVVWRISDPRGFDLEISSENFASIINCCDLEKGTIKGRCVWGRAGANNVLLPEASEPYQQASTLTKKSQVKISTRDLQPGDMVEILSPNTAEGVEKCQYLGKYWFITFENDHNDRSHYTTRFNHKQVERFLFKNLKGDHYNAIATPRISAVVERADTPISKLDVANQINQQLAAGEYVVYNMYSAMLVSPVKVNLDDVKTRLEPVNFSYQEGQAWPTLGKDRYHSRTFVVRYQDQLYITKKDLHGACYNKQDPTADHLKLVPIKYTEGEAHLQTQWETYSPRGMWGFTTHQRTKVVDKFDYDALQYFDLKIRVGDVERAVGYIQA